MPNSKKKWIPLKGGVCHLRKQPQIQCGFCIYPSKSVNLQIRGKNEPENTSTACCLEQTALDYWLELTAYQQQLKVTAALLLPVLEAHSGATLPRSEQIHTGRWTSSSFSSTSQLSNRHWPKIFLFKHAFKLKIRNETIRWSLKCALPYVFLLLNRVPSVHQKIYFNHPAAIF